MSHVTALTLGGLSRAEAAALVEQTAGAGALPPATVAGIVERTFGVPLFVEELTRAVAEGAGHDIAAAGTPGDPAAIIAGDQATPAQLERIRESMGLNDPIPVQFATWVGQLVRGDLGTSLISNQPVTHLIGARIVFIDGTPDILVYPRDRAAYGRLSRLLIRAAPRRPAA